MKTNNNNNRNENNAAKVAAIVKNEGRIVAAIKKGNHTTREIIPAADMFTEYTEFCEAIAALQIAGMVECRENGYYLTEKGEYLTEYDNETEEAAAEIASESEDETPAETVEVVNETTTAYHHTTAARIAQVCKTIAEAVGEACAAEDHTTWELEALRDRYVGLLCNKDEFNYTPEELQKLKAEDITEMLQTRALNLYHDKEKLFGEETFREIRGLRDD